MFNPETFKEYALSRLERLARKKYDKGQAEHGGYLVDRVELKDIEDEIIDCFFYCTALRVKMGELEEEKDGSRPGLDKKWYGPATN